MSDIRLFANWTDDQIRGALDAVDSCASESLGGFTQDVLAQLVEERKARGLEPRWWEERA